MAVRNAAGVEIVDRSADLTGPLIDIPGVWQEQSNWCWAACGEMLFNFHHRPKFIDQTCLAESLFNCTCSAGDPQCDTPIRANQVLDLLMIMGLNCRVSAGPITETALRQEIDDHRPVEAGVLWQGGLSGHLVVLRGYAVDDHADGCWVDVNDPALRIEPGPDPLQNYGGCRYSELQAYNGTGSWAWTFFDLRR
jgi:hypothetical protein